MQYFFLNRLFISFVRLIQDFVGAYEYNIMIHSLWSTITIVGTLLMFQMEIVEYFRILLIILFISVFLFTTNELSQSLSMENKNRIAKNCTNDYNLLK